MTQPPTILVLSAVPLNEPRVRVDQELRDINDCIRKAGKQDALRFVHEPAARVRDLHSHLLIHRPTVVHVSSHGNRKGQLILEHDDGNAKPVDRASLAQTFAVFSKTVRGVVLNACHSLDQANEIAAHIDFVVGMSDTIDDRSAVGFSSSFYIGLASGMSLEDAFQLGQAGAGLQAGLNRTVPTLQVRTGIAAQRYFVLKANLNQHVVPTTEPAPVTGAQPTAQPKTPVLRLLEPQDLSPEELRLEATISAGLTDDVDLVRRRAIDQLQGQLRQGKLYVGAMMTARGILEDPPTDAVRKMLLRLFTEARRAGWVPRNMHERLIQLWRALPKGSGAAFELQDYFREFPDGLDLLVATVGSAAGLQDHVAAQVLSLFRDKIRAEAATGDPRLFQAMANIARQYQQANREAAIDIWAIVHSGPVPPPQ